MVHFITYYPQSIIGDSLRKKYWSKKLSKQVKYFGRGSVINGKDKIYVGHKLILGENVVITNSGGFGIYIGDNVGIAHNSYMRSANHCFDDLNKPIRNQGHTSKSVNFNNNSYSIVIEDDVWIGAGTIILSGSHIGEGCVINAGSVISSKIPPYSIVVGNPARVILNRKKIKNEKY